MRALCFLCVMVVLGSGWGWAAGSPGEPNGAGGAYTLREALEYALAHNPALRQSATGVRMSEQGVKAAQGERLPKIDFASGATAYRYPAPVTPITAASSARVNIPEFSDRIYDFGFTFSLPLFRGGRLERAVEVARIKQLIAGNQLQTTRQDLIYNVTSAYYKILQLKELVRVAESQVEDVQAIKRQVDSFVKAGTRAPLDLLKAEVELARARENALVVGNNLQTTQELLKKLMGVDDAAQRVDVVPELLGERPCPPLDEGLKRAFERRPEYQGVTQRVRVANEQLKIAEGRRLPSVLAIADYTKRAGESLAFKEIWTAGVRMVLPVFDGGIIRSDIETQRLEVERAKEEERSLRHSILNEVKDAYADLDNASRRVEVARQALDPARENRRVELLKYETGAGTMVDSLDAQTALVRAEYDYYRALFDREIAFAAVQRALGDGALAEGGSR